MLTETIEPFDTVKSRVAIPYAYVPAGSLGMVTGVSDEEEGLFEVEFYHEDGSSYPTAIVPRAYLKLDSKS